MTQDEHRGAATEHRRAPAEGVVVGVSATDSGATALDWGLRHAELRDLPLLAVRAWDIPSYGSYYSVGGALRSTDPEHHLAEQRIAQDSLDAALGRRASTAPLPARAAAHEGRPAEVLLSAADKAALLVVGTRGAGALTRLVHLGSVSASVLHDAHVPVAIVPQQARVPDVAAPVVVGWDGSAPSTAALRWAVEQARVAGAPLVPVAVHGRGDAGDQADERAALQAAVTEAGGSDLRVEPQVRVGHAAEELMTVAQDASLLVLGSRGRGGFSRLLVGSTSTQCAGHAPCPMVVLRAG